MSDSGIIFAVGVRLVCLLVAINESRRSRRGPKLPEEPPKHDRARIALAGPHSEVPLSQRKRVLKICPDCREYVLLDAPVCKYCGCALAIDRSQTPDQPAQAQRD